jgi:Fe-S-cluster-containing hydrogenase component 2
MDRLKLLDAGLRAFDARLPDVVPPLCLATRYRGSSCRRCLAVCPGDAIATSPWLQVDPERCTSCGACAAVCPTGALAYGARAGELRVQFAEAQGSEGGEVTVVCKPAAHAVAGFAATEHAAAREAETREPAAAGEAATTTVVVACLGGLSAADVIGAAAAGCTALRLESVDCEACRERVAGDAAEAAVAAALETLAALGRDLRVTRHRLPGPPTEAGDDAAGLAPDAAGLTRRDLFAFLARGARRTASEGLAPQRRGIADLHGQASPSASHARLLDDLRALGAGEASSARLQPPSVRLPRALPLATLTVSPGCTGCGLCVRYCPHAALALADGVLTCDTSLCTGCGLCAEACPPAALELSPAVV